MTLMWMQSAMLKLRPTISGKPPIAGDPPTPRHGDAAETLVTLAPLLSIRISGPLTLALHPPKVNQSQLL